MSLSVMGTGTHTITMAPWSLVDPFLGKQLPNSQFVLQGFLLKATLQLKDLPLLGLDLFRIGLGIYPKAPQLEPFLGKLPAKFGRILGELLLLGLELFFLFRREIRIWVGPWANAQPPTRTIASTIPMAVSVFFVFLMVFTSSC